METYSYKLQNECDLNNYTDNSSIDLYIHLVKSMLEFLDKLNEFSRQISKPILANLDNPLNEQLIKEFYELNKVCDEMEDGVVKAKLFNRILTIILEELKFDIETTNGGYCNLSSCMIF